MCCKRVLRVCCNRALCMCCMRVISHVCAACVSFACAACASFKRAERNGVGSMFPLPRNFAHMYALLLSGCCRFAVCCRVVHALYGRGHRYCKFDAITQMADMFNLPYTGVIDRPDLQVHIRASPCPAKIVSYRNACTVLENAPACPAIDRRRGLQRV